MSHRNGDRARFDRAQKRKRLRRARARALRKKLEHPATPAVVLATH